MSRSPAAPSLRRELVVWYSAVLLLALLSFAGVSYAVLRQTLRSTAAASLQQTAATTEQLLAPAYIPRVEVREERIEPGPGAVEALRRRTRLATGQVLDIYVARSGEVETHALRSFLLLAAVLIPLTAAGAALGAYSIAGRLLQPLQRLVAATRAIEIRALAQRVEEPERPAELRELAQSFNAMLTRLERAVETLRRFTADASHELRTPLTAIKGTAQVALARERSAAELRDTLGEVLDETEWMLGLVEGLLTLARGEDEPAEPQRQPLDLVPLLEDVREVGEALAAGRPLAVRLQAPDALRVSGAAGRLRQVLLNLVSNAVRFTAEGEVVLRAARRADGWAEVAVEDTGAGIAPAELPRVFDRFYRGDAARERGGTGLGLAIARLIVEQHGGRIEAESEPGRGSVFRVLLPPAAEPGAEPGPA